MLKKLDQSSLLIFSIFTLLVGFGDGPTYILYQFISFLRAAALDPIVSLQQQQAGVSSLEVKYDIFRYRDEGTWTGLNTLPETGFDTEVCSYLNLSQIDCEPSREC